MTFSGPLAYRALMLSPRYTVPLALAVFQTTATIGAANGQPDRVSPDALAFVLLLVGPAGLVFRRRHPVSVLAVVLAATLAYIARGYPFGPVFASVVVAFFVCVRLGRRREAWALAGLSYVALLVLGATIERAAEITWLHAAAVAAWLVVVLVVAEIYRVRSERAIEAAHARDEEARRRASEERLRIARELHDVVAHNISLINVQAGVALHLIDEQPEQARTALAAIKDASKEALGELRSVLGILRQIGDGEAEAAPRRPAPSLERLDDLVSGARAAGLTVRVEIEGAPRPLPAGVDLAAFRIVQEALTNVARHAGPVTGTTVRVRYGDRRVAVQVDDDGRGSPVRGTSNGAGSGIAGMRERAAALGGLLEAGPRPGGGFRVRAELPLDDGGEVT